MKNKEYDKAYKKAVDVVEEFYRLTDEDNPNVVEFWKVNAILKAVYKSEPKVKNE